MLRRIHTKLGDFWWYSIMIFCACRTADFLNAFVGLWLVPKHVDPSELGAVIPLTQFAGFIAIPVSVFAMTFMKEMTVLATNKEYGKMKSLMRGVFIGTGIFLVVTLGITRFTLPYFLERIRIAEGSLGVLIISTGFIGAIAPVYSNALQALKRFKTISFLSIAGAPIRFITMLLMMPFRAISGYFAGQASTPAFSIIASIWALRKELSVPAEPYWSYPVFKRFSVVFIGIAACNYASSILGLSEQTVLRQRLPDIDSAAYYMTTRFSDIACFMHSALITVLFPFTTSLAAEGKPTRPLVIKSSLAMIATGILLAVIFSFFGGPILTILPNGNKYIEYAWVIPCLIIITSISSIQSFHTNTEASAGRFGFLKWWIPVNLIFAIGLISITGYGYFTPYIPTKWCNFLATYNFTSLKAMLIWFAITSLVKTTISITELIRQPKFPLPRLK